MSVFHMPEVIPNSSGLQIVSNVGQFVSRSGYVQTDARGGERLTMRMNWTFKRTAERRRLLGIIARLNGRQHRLAVRDHSYSGPAGSLSVSELQPSLRVANYNTTSWLTQTDLDDGFRNRRVNNDVNGHAVLPTVNPTTVAGLSYACKSAIIAYSKDPSGGRTLYASTASGAGDLLDSGNVAHVTGVYVGAAFSPATTIRFGPVDNGIAGSGNSFFDYTYTSMARCLLVDNGVNVLSSPAR